MIINTALVVVLALAAAAIILSMLYFRRFRIERPPIGVFNLQDVAFMMVGIILVPFLYVWLPTWLVGALLALSTLSLLYFMWEPVLRARLAVWLAVLLMLGADIWASMQYGATSAAFYAINDIVILAVIVGLTNLWAQSGMKARDVAILAGFLALYDFTATTLLPLMGDMMLRLAGLPLAPDVVWSGASGAGGTLVFVGIGLGDLLLASVFPLVMRKAFGRGAGYGAMLLAMVAICGVFFLPISTVFLAMVVLGPLMVAQYIYWARRKGQERTTWQYLQAEPVVGSQ